MVMRMAARLLGLSVGVCSILMACSAFDAKRPPALSTGTQLRVAEAADASGDRGLAISMYRDAAASEPSDIALQLRYVDALVRSGEIAQARQMLKERLRTSTTRQPELIRALALIDLVAGQPEQASKGFDEVLAANPGDIRALVDKAVALDLLGQHGAAQALYHRVLATAPNDAAVTNNLAVSMMLEGRIREALEILAPMQDADTSPARLRINLGILYAAIGTVDRSRQLLGDRVSDGDLLRLTRAIASSARESGAGP